MTLPVFGGRAPELQPKAAGGSNVFDGAEIYLSADYATSGTGTIPFDAVLYDRTIDDNYTDALPGITIPRLGFYLIRARLQVHFSLAGAGAPYFAAARLYVNGTVVDYDQRRDPAAVPVTITPEVFWIAGLSATQVVTVGISTATYAATIDGGQPSPLSSLSVAYLGSY